MDIHALWSRMDHLERIILEQGKEIDRLKQMLANNSRPTNYSPDENTSQLPDALQQTLNPQSRKQQSALNPSSVRIDDTQRNSFHMSSYVHPQSAVPPFARWPTDSTDKLPAEKAKKTNATLSYHPSNRNSFAGLQHSPRLSQPITTARPLVQNRIMLNYQDNESDGSSSQQANKNQGLIEVLTCFCPCFSMC